MFPVITSKLRSICGDSIAEALVAILIAALGVTALATMTMASTSIVSTNETVMNAVYAAEATVAEKVSTNSDAEDDTLVITGLTSATVSIDIDVYKVELKDRDESFIRYMPAQP